MKLFELKRASSGTYVAVLPTPGTQALLDAWAAENRFQLDLGLHVTLLYSRQTLTIDTDPTVEFIAAPIGFELFGSSLVIKLNSPALSARHEQFIAQGGTHDFPTYQPHVTLAYEAGRLKPSDIEPIKFGMVFSAEYTETII